MAKIKATSRRLDARFESCHELYENVMRDGLLHGDAEVKNSDVELNGEDH